VYRYNQSGVVATGGVAIAHEPAFTLADMGVRCQFIRRPSTRLKTRGVDLGKRSEAREP